MTGNFLFSFLSAMLLCSCTGHFITDRNYRDTVASDFASRSELLEKSGIDLSSMSLSSEEKEALEFLYAYMPLGDLVNMPAGYWLDNYRLTNKALDELPWGGSIPEREARHFVLPVRVNNENLDTSRTVFFKELAPRVAGLSMYDAVLEVNHWCHEKAVYQPTDSRTSSPLSTVKTAYGRCGEESTFLVAALRSVGIPARQVYTPRWAHTDDNHAWVEAWVDGRWHFLGACEPEPVLDLGWFNAPASRGMLMHTKVFGRYDGPEEVVKVTPNSTEINVISNYSPNAARLDVTVLDAGGVPVPGAKVEYKLYNYAEFFSVAAKTADESGRSFLTAGIGDMLVYATDGDRFGMEKVSFGKDASITVTLDRSREDGAGHLSFEVVPPVENAGLPEVTEAQRTENTRRMAEEDSLRAVYVATFFDKDEALAFTGNLFGKRDVSSEAADMLVASRGNHTEICTFLSEAVSAGRGEEAVRLLASVSEKDLRDTPSSVFADHLYNTPEGADPDRIMCPRVSKELLAPYRGYLKASVPEELADRVYDDPAFLVEWCRKNISLHDSVSLGYVQVSPVRVWDTRLADKASRDIFFVALCRTLGVPAWKDQVTGKVKYISDGHTYDVDFDAEVQTSSPKGRVRLEYRPIPLLDNPKYYTHFTISRYEDGSFRLMNYPEETTWDSVFRNGAELDCGYYMLVGGTRMSGGNVLADIEFFEVKEEECTDVPLVIRDDESQIRVIGSFNSEARYCRMPAPSGDMAAASESSVLATTGRGYFAVAIVDYGHEPTDHALKDISKAAYDLEKWGRPMLVIFASENDYLRFKSSDYNLPSTVSFGIDTDGSMRKMVASEMKLRGKGALPLVLVADTFNRVVFFSEGYTIGLGDRLVRTVKSL